MPSNAQKRNRNRPATPASPPEMPPMGDKPEDPPVAEDATEAVESPVDDTPVDLPAGTIIQSAAGDSPLPVYPTFGIHLPLADHLPAGRSHRAHVDAHLRGPHGATMHRLREALDKSAARLRDGKVVHTMPDALKWMLEQIEDRATEGGAA